MLTGHIRFPLEFTRADTGKAMHIAGDLHFKLCTADGTCQAAATHHGLTLRASDKAEDSIHYNYVTQGFAQLPPAESRHAQGEQYGGNGGRRGRDEFCQSPLRAWRRLCPRYI